MALPRTTRRSGAEWSRGHRPLINGLSYLALFRACAARVDDGTARCGQPNESCFVPGKPDGEESFVAVAC